MRTLVHSILPVALVLSGLACAAQTDTSPAGSLPVGGKADGASAVELGIDDDGTTVQVPQGYAVVVRLPANPTAGFRWRVISTDRTFGYPEEDFVVDESGRVGSGGVAVLTWQTGGFVRAGGTHTVGLGYARGDAEPSQTFGFTVEIVDAIAPDAPAGIVELTIEDDGTTVQVQEGFDLVVKLAANPSTGYQWSVRSTDRTFGYPEQSFEADDPDLVGSPGTVTLTWHTGGFVRAGESHAVELAYARDSGRALRIFDFTVEIVAQPAPPASAVELTTEDNGAVVEVPEGSDVVVRLSANPSTGFEWKVVSTDRTFGYPEADFVIDESGPIGSGGIAVLTWHTGGFVRAGGQHSVTLEYRRPGDPDAEAADTFTFTVEIVDP